MGAPALDLSDPRLWNFIDKSKGPDACWPWTGAQRKHGYGVVKRQGKRFTAHRVAYEQKHGPVPANLSVRHLCDNPPCCNPAHLIVGTHAENMAEMSLRGRARGKAPGGDQHYLRREPERAIRGEDRTQAKLTEAAVLDMRARWPGEKQSDLAAEYGVSQMTVSNILRRKRWTHI
jgi:hypothetical protein